MDIAWIALFVATAINVTRGGGCNCCRQESIQQKIDTLNKAIQELENGEAIKKHEQVLKDAQIYGLLISITDHPNEVGNLRVKIEDCRSQTLPGTTASQTRTQMHKKVESYTKQTQELEEQYGENKTELIQLLSDHFGILAKYMKEVFNLQLLNDLLKTLNDHLKTIMDLKHQFNSVKQRDENKRPGDFKYLEKYLKYLETGTTIYERLEAGLKHREKVQEAEGASLDEIKSNVSKVKSLADLKTALLDESRQPETLHRIYPAMLTLRGLHDFKIKHLDTLKEDPFRGLCGIDVIKKVAEIYKLRRRNQTMKELQNMATEMGIGVNQSEQTHATGDANPQSLSSRASTSKQ